MTVLNLQMNQIAEFSQINGLVVTPHTEGKQNLKLFLTNGKVSGSAKIVILPVGLGIVSPLAPVRVSSPLSTMVWR